MYFTTEVTFFIIQPLPLTFPEEVSNKQNDIRIQQG